MKAFRYNSYPSGMVAEKSGQWIHLSQLPKKVVEEFVESYVRPEGADDSDDDSGGGE